jgi:acyl-CoA thioesterase
MDQDREQRARKIVLEGMFAKDAFSQQLGMQVRQVKPGYCILDMTVEDFMTNGFGIAHGGIAFSLADSALAFAANAKGQESVTVESQLSLVKAIVKGDALCAEAKEVVSTRNLGRYEVIVTNQKSEIVAIFKGTVFIKEKVWEV